LESPLVSAATRSHLETFREQLEKDIAEAKRRQPEEIGAS